jgi:hypothetical protein
MKKTTNTLIILSVFVLIFTACTKNDAGTLSGDWEFVYFSSNSTGETQTWTFDGSSTLDISITKTDTVLTNTGTYSYYSKSFSKDELDLGSLGSYTDGKYVIHKLKNGHLAIERISLPNSNEKGAFMWKEFIRK